MTEARRTASDPQDLTAACRTCGGPVDRGPARRCGRRRVHCEQCRPPKPKPRPVSSEHVRELLGEVLDDPPVSPTHRAVLERVIESAQLVGWRAQTLDRTLAGLRRVFEGHPDGQPVRRSQLNSELGAATSSARLAGMVLSDMGLFTADTEPTMRQWIDRQCEALPEGFRVEVRTWLITLLEGGERAKPRSKSTLYVYFGRVRPHLVAWSRSRRRLREVTESDVAEVLNAQSGHQRAGTFTALRSLFGFAKRHHLIFADPTRRISVGRAPARTMLPMTEAEVARVKKVAASPAQRLVIALAAVYAARAMTIRNLTLDDIDLSARRIKLGGHTHTLSRFVHDALNDWLRHRHSAWPHTPNRHILISRESAAGTQPVSDYYLSWHLLLLGVQLEQIRGDRILQEALAVRADPLHLARTFQLSPQTAIEYADIARNLLERPLDTALTSLETSIPDLPATVHGASLVSSPLRRL